MRLALGIIAGITISILAYIIWKPALGWALSRGDGE